MEDADPSSALLTGEFGKQFGGSAVANLATVVVLGLLMGLKKLCNRPSRCKSHIHCPCLDIEVLDRTKSVRQPAPKNTDQSGPGFV